MTDIVETLTQWLGLESGYALKYLGLRGGLPLWALGAGVCGAAALAAVLYAIEPVISRASRVVLALLRTAVFSLVVFFLFAPVVGIERSRTVRPNVIVMVDRSESMAIADPRTRPQEQVEASLAVGAARFPMAHEQEALARARRAVASCAASVKQNLWQDALAADGEARDALAAAAARPAGAGDQPENVARGIRELVRLQDEVRAAVEECLGTPVQAPEQVAGLRQKEEAIRRQIEELEGEMAAAPAAAVPDATTDGAPVTRARMARGLLDRPELDRLAEASDVHVFSFGERLEDIGNAGGGLRVPAEAVEPTGKATFGAHAIREAVGAFSSDPVAGVVLLTDGAFNDEDMPALGVAGWLREQGVPLVVTGLGLQSPTDVGLRSLIVQDVMFPKDLVTARLQVAARGYGGEKVPVTALLDGVEVAKRSIELADDPQFVELTFRVPEGKGGQHRLTFEVPAQRGEVSVENNRIEKPVRIVDQKIKVLFVEGRPRWEYRYLRVLLQRDPRLDVQFLMTQGDADLALGSKEYLARYPESAEDAFSYDLVILGDVPSWYFNRAQLDRIAELVRDRGGSLLMLSGEQYAPVSYLDTPLADMLPVRATREYVQIPGSVFPVATPAGKRSLALLADSPAQSDEAWSLVRPLHRMARLDGAKPGATVLVELPEGPSRPEPYPLVAWQYFGMGKVMYVGTDQLWRMRFKLGDRHHSRFWGQAAQFLALSRLLGENKRIRIESDGADQVRVGQRVEIHANVLDPSYQPVSGDSYVVDLVPAASPGGDTMTEPLAVTLAAVPGSPGLFQGSHVFRDQGQYVLKARGEDARFANSLDIVVSTADLEGLEPAMQEPLLRKMAAVSGGRYLSVREWPALPGVIHARQRVLVESREIDLWDRWPPFVVLLLAAGAEWLLRRRLNLV